MDNDPFDLLGLPACFALEEDLLETHYRKAQWITHPDQCGYAQEVSARMNAAYLALKDPLKRAECLLKRFVAWPPLERPEVLEEIFDRRVSGRGVSREEIAQAYVLLSGYFAAQQYEAATDTYVRLCYLEKLPVS